jgi:endoglucanase
LKVKVVSALALALARFTAAAEMPEVVHVGMVAPDIISVTVQAGRAEYGQQVPYQPQPNDRVDRKTHQRWVHRDGKFIGALVGKDEKILYTPDRAVGPKLDTAWADMPASYAIRCAEDPNYAGDGTPPVAVHRKSRPTDFARVGPWQMEAPMEHTLYLRLPKPLVVGRGYLICFRGGHLIATSFTWEPAKLRSEAIQVSHLGFRPDDPAKVAFLSCWMGSGGGVTYKEGLRFDVLDANGKSVFQGKVALSRAAADPEDAYKRNYNGVPVYEMDFSPLKAPGTYRVAVEGVGCSHPFPIADDTWRKAFTVSARGFYHQRSGIELGPPYTTFKRPRPFHPDDGLKVFLSNCGLMDSGNGLNRKDNNFGNLNKGRTDQLVPNAWGGYMDAGDWDRRIQHLVVSRLLLELADLFPDYFAAVPLNIPESGNGLPDAVNEALFKLDCYRRMQTPEGGIRGGIESEEHPRHGEGSWQESLTVMAYAPCAWSSYVYAGVAARAAHCLATAKTTPGVVSRNGPPGASQKRLLESFSPKAYRDSALRAMQWAEKELKAAGDKQFPTDVRDSRNLAAIELFRLTGDKEWLDIFLATTFFKDSAADLWKWQSHEQRDAAWVVLRTDRPGLDPQLKANCRAAILREADERLDSQAKAGFRFLKYAWRPFGWGAPVTPEAESVVRAHALTGDAKYLRALVLAAQFGGGANPLNLCYTTGIGHKWPQHPLHIDSRITHQPPPPGLTIFGPQDVERSKNDWGAKLIGQFAFPPVAQWPTAEAYWDVFWYPAVCEFTVQQPMAANAYLWGYLAARK